MTSPKKVWFVEILPGGTPLRYRDKGGGHFTQEQAARQRYNSHVRAGRNVRLLSTIPNWVEEDSHVEVE